MPATDSDTNNNQPWITPTPRHRNRPPRSNGYRRCGNCYSTEHVFADCSDNQCNQCKRLGHISAHCPRNLPKLNYCKVCDSTEHQYADCTHNRCYKCNEFGYISIRCPLAPLKRDNQHYRYRYSRDKVEDRRMVYYSHKRINHCCKCKTLRFQKIFASSIIL